MADTSEETRSGRIMEHTPTIHLLGLQCKTDVWLLGSCTRVFGKYPIGTVWTTFSACPVWTASSTPELPSSAISGNRSDNWRKMHVRVQHVALPSCIAESSLIHWSPTTTRYKIPASQLCSVIASTSQNNQPRVFRSPVSRSAVPDALRQNIADILLPTKGIAIWQSSCQASANSPSIFHVSPSPTARSAVPH